MKNVSLLHSTIPWVQMENLSQWNISWCTSPLEWWQL